MCTDKYYQCLKGSVAGKNPLGDMSNFSSSSSRISSRSSSGTESDLEYPLMTLPIFNAAN